MARSLIRSYIQARNSPLTKGGFLVAISLLCFASPLDAVRNRYYDDANTNALKEMRDSFEEVRHEMRNHEIEIRTFDEKLKNIDVILDSLRDHITDSSLSQKESLKGSAASLENKIASLENSCKDLADDMRQFKTHANETSTTLAQHKQKLGELEKIIEQQNRNLEHLQAAMQSLMAALGSSPVPDDKVPTTEKTTKSSTSPNSNRIYIVKSGDSLEKIARRHQTTIQAIKELNGLTSDRIIVGKKLQLPEEP